MVGVTFDNKTISLSKNCIKEAENEINKWVSKRYNITSYLTTTAYSSLPPLLQTWNDRLAEGYMWVRLSRGSKESISRGKELIKDVKDCLMALADNEIDLFDSSGSIVSELENPQQVLSNTEDYHTTFDEDDPLNWSIDKDKVDDIISDRD